ncbi:MAG: pyridoxamine 5'-phosphate oxidase family protein [Deltaproteobacteria bacterium]|jgi:nitroimidazol reductase NimA-like FMN-containing flavoprotein (pyridoxamine 5'-phosphate oxidase superfamily)|nr:pyridoxamine 5'-phosphate oxidase family protein [Deltaproteobacteria bacterium]
MQERMRTHRLTEAQIAKLLGEAQIGQLGTIGPNGYPYVIPVHYVYLDGAFYFHGLDKGQKLDNIEKNPNVCFQVTSDFSYLHADTPCDTNTAYQSVVCLGKAFVVTDDALKLKILRAVVDKYAPRHNGKPFPEAMLEVTATVGITVEELHGKYFS